MATTQTRGGTKATASTAGGKRSTKAAPKAAAQGTRSRPAAAGARSTGATKTATKPATKAATKADAGRSVTVPLTGVRVPMAGVRVPGADKVTRSTRQAADAVRSYLPPVERIVYYGGLGTAALVGVLEWPVAIAAGVGVWVASQTRRPVDRAASK